MAIEKTKLDSKGFSSRKGSVTQKRSSVTAEQWHQQAGNKNIMLMDPSSKLRIVPYDNSIVY